MVSFYSDSRPSRLRRDCFIILLSVLLDNPHCKEGGGKKTGRKNRILGIGNIKIIHASGRRERLER